MEVSTRYGTIGGISPTGDVLVGAGVEVCGDGGAYIIAMLVVYGPDKPLNTASPSNAVDFVNSVGLY